MDAAAQLKIALVAHDARKAQLVEWVGIHLARISRWPIVSTGTTGQRIRESYPSLDVECVKSGPYGGDQQIGARIVEGRIRALIFFVDPLAPMPHDVDVKALVRLSTLYDIPTGCSPSTATLVLAGL